MDKDIKNKGEKNMKKNRNHFEDSNQDNTLFIDINLSRKMFIFIVLFLFSILYFSYLVLGKETSFASAQGELTTSSGMRQFYLARIGADGGAALTVCEEGYHMASLWEILDPSNLKYNTDLGVTRTDSGEGPVTYWGWVRTGYVGSTSDVPGRGNCNGWTTNVSDAYGTLVNLAQQWDPNYANIHVWETGTITCNITQGTWCVQD